MRIVSNGERNLYAALEPQIRSEVESEHAEELKTAGFWKRRRLRSRIEEEIRRRVNEKLPRDALY